MREPNDPRRRVEIVIVRHRFALVSRQSPR
jgi:hypothetical protein